MTDDSIWQYFDSIRSEEPMSHNTAQVEVDGMKISLEVGHTSEGQPFVRVLGLNCNLEGEEPGLYFPTPL